MKRAAEEVTDGWEQVDSETEADQEVLNLFPSGSEKKIPPHVILLSEKTGLSIEDTQDRLSKISETARLSATQQTTLFLLLNKISFSEAKQLSLQYGERISELSRHWYQRTISLETIMLITSEKEISDLFSSLTDEDCTFLKTYFGKYLQHFESEKKAVYKFDVRLNRESRLKKLIDRRYISSEEILTLSDDQVETLVKSQEWMLFSGKTVLEILYLRDQEIQFNSEHKQLYFCLQLIALYKMSFEQLAPYSQKQLDLINKIFLLYLSGLIDKEQIDLLLIAHSDDSDDFLDMNVLSTTIDSFTSAEHDLLVRWIYPHFFMLNPDYLETLGINIKDFVSIDSLLEGGVKQCFAELNLLMTQLKQGYSVAAKTSSCHDQSSSSASFASETSSGSSYGAMFGQMGYPSAGGGRCSAAAVAVEPVYAAHPAAPATVDIDDEESKSSAAHTPGTF